MMNDPTPKLGKGSWIVAAIVALLAAAWFGSSLVRSPAPYEGFDLNTFGKLPVSYGGRYKPIDTVARNSLLILNRREKLVLDAEPVGTLTAIWRRVARQPNGTPLPPLAWLMDVKTKPQHAAGYPVFRVDHPEVRSLFGQDGSTAKRFSYRQIEPARQNIDQLARQAANVDRALRSTFQHQLLSLAQDLTLFETLRAHAAARTIPLPAMNDWATYADSLAVLGSARGRSQTLDAYRDLYHAWHTDDAARFNARSAELLNHFQQHYPQVTRKAAVEWRFNQVSPFYKAMVLYIVAGLLVLISWVVLPDTLRRSALALILVGLIAHTAALVVRVYLSGRPPVTNLYSSAVFIGWGVVALSLLLELMLRRGLGLIVGCAVGVATLLIAQGLSADGDTLAVLQAVLDTNFWLATHVIVITIGYVAVFVAGGLGTLFVLLGVFSKGLDKPTAKKLTSATYGIIALATIASFVGTILGGIWADQSWGRFWGWDPKENGALMIVLWCAIILHARWGGLVRERGIAVLAIFGNVVCAWSWFGTNMLGAGLHSYGFTDAAFTGMMAFLTTQAILIALGTMPLEAWRSGANLMPTASRRPQSE